MNKNKKIWFVVGGIIVLAAVFYAGMSYGKGQAPTRGQGIQTFGQNGTGARGGRNGGGFSSGQIIAKDDKSITISLMGGGSKIVFLDTSTKISKQTEGTSADLTVGTQVSVTGTANTDGSENAQTVQIRPNTTTSVVK